MKLRSTTGERGGEGGEGDGGTTTTPAAFHSAVLAMHDATCAMCGGSQWLAHAHVHSAGSRAVSMTLLNSRHLLHAVHCTHDDAISYKNVPRLPLLLILPRVGPGR